MTMPDPSPSPPPASVHRTTCNRDCPDGCSILVTVEDGRATALAGDPHDPTTRGFLCERTNRFLSRQYAADRFLTPLLRTGGELRPVSWAQALDVAAEKLLQARAGYGPASILHYKSGGSLGLLKHLACYLFEQFGPVTIKRGDICSGAGEAAQAADFGMCDSHDVHDLHNSELIILWGKNVHTSGPHLLPVLNEARRRGALLVGIDPVRTRQAKMCDLFLQPRPGADFALAMALARYLFDHALVAPDAADYCDGLDGFRALAHRYTSGDWAARADVAAADARRFAELVGAHRPAAFLIGWGMGRRANGSRTVRAIDALAAVTGNLGVAGGGASFYFDRKQPFDLSFLRGAEAAPRTFAEARLGREILAATEPPCRVVWVTAGNPVAMLPDAPTVRRALTETDFTVVVDTHPTDTTDCADLVLPTLTLLEDDDVMGSFGNHYIRTSRPAVAAPDGPRHELDILQDLAARLGVADALKGTVRDWKRRLLARLEGAGTTLDELERGAVRNPFVGPVLFPDRAFPTATGRVQLLTEAPLPPPATDDEFPLTLLAVSTPKAQSSQWADGPLPGPLPAHLHPNAAAGYRDGDVAVLESRHGAMLVTVRVDERVRPDVALLAKGGMYRHGPGPGAATAEAATGQCVNALIPAVETDDGGGAAYYDEPVRLRSPTPVA